ncbi:eye-globin isoform X2 [Gallus gallus]|uniref:eye-globin isoform X2 n=1 Tax=Gallus gallus TaxID=9031 RepID=UPI001AE55FB9|nr:eye-globin isoform X2 [Gallus gallus]XP_046763376.1 eye-globin isoform X2 [Gallus gallus]
MDGKGIDMYGKDRSVLMKRMFTEHPDTKSYFTHFKGMDSAEEMKQSDQVRGHGKRVFTAINDMVQHLDNTEAFLGILNPLGQKHATQLKIDPKNFRIICDIILQLMEEKFGGDCKASFEKVTNEICTHLTNIYKEAEPSAQRGTSSLYFAILISDERNSVKHLLGQWTL